MKQKYFFLSLLILFLIAGCQPTMSRYLGAQANKKEANALVQGEKQNQRWVDLYLMVNYSYKRDGDHLRLKGHFSFAGSAKLHYKSVPDLRLKVFFLDEKFRVVEYSDLTRTLSPDLDQQRPFTKAFKLQPNVTSITFGYEGELAGDDADRSSIWKLPKLSL